MVGSGTGTRLDEFGSGAGVSYQQVGAEARHALDLDPQLAEAHETLAIIA